MKNIVMMYKRDIADNLYRQLMKHLMIFLAEVKGEERIDKADVLAKKDRALRYCQVVSEWSKANGYKEWQYVFIPSKQISESSTFDNLVKRFLVDEDTDVMKE